MSACRRTSNVLGSTVPGIEENRGIPYQGGPAKPGTARCHIATAEHQVIIQMRGWWRTTAETPMEKIVSGVTPLTRTRDGSTATQWIVEQYRVSKKIIVSRPQILIAITQKQFVRFT